jgi:hypothetical protein
VLVPDPLVIIAPGFRVRLHVPEEGNPLSAILPVPSVQVRLVTVPIIGTSGMAFTVNV